MGNQRDALEEIACYLLPVYKFIEGQPAPRSGEFVQLEDADRLRTMAKDALPKPRKGKKVAE